MFKCCWCGKKESTISPGDICMDCVKNRVIDIYECAKCFVVSRSNGSHRYNLCEECMREINEK